MAEFAMQQLYNRFRHLKMGGGKTTGFAEHTKHTQAKKMNRKQ